MTGQVSSVKQQLITILQELPDDSSYDELIKELAFARMVDRGLADVKAGRVVTNDDARRQIESWRKQP
jgi:predicted transcriptional regulator